MVRGAKDIQRRVLENDLLDFHQSQWTISSALHRRDRIGGDDEPRDAGTFGRQAIFVPPAAVRLAIEAVRISRCRSEP
jgi:hypothetical protein